MSDRHIQLFSYFHPTKSEMDADQIDVTKVLSQ